jgi:hypothetical protein
MKSKFDQAQLQISYLSNEKKEYQNLVKLSLNQHIFISTPLFTVQLGRYNQRVFII